MWQDKPYVFMFFSLYFFCDSYLCLLFLSVYDGIPKPPDLYFVCVCVFMCVCVSSEASASSRPAEDLRQKEKRKRQSEITRSPQRSALSPSGNISDRSDRSTSTKGSTKGSTDCRTVEENQHHFLCVSAMIFCCCFVGSSPDDPEETKRHQPPATEKRHEALSSEEKRKIYKYFLRHLLRTSQARNEKRKLKKVVKEKLNAFMIMIMIMIMIMWYMYVFCIVWFFVVVSAAAAAVYVVVCCLLLLLWESDFLLWAIPTYTSPNTSENFS